MRHLGAVSDMTGFGHDLRANTLEETKRLGAEGDYFDFDTPVVEFANVIQGLFEQVGVQAAAQTPIGRDRNDTGTLDLALDQERMLVLGVRTGHVMHHFGDALGIRPSSEHLVLGTAHLARRHHFHRRSDLLSVLDTRDLGLYLFAASHI